MIRGILRVHPSGLNSGWQQIVSEHAEPCFPNIHSVSHPDTPPPWQNRLFGESFMQEQSPLFNRFLELAEGSHPEKFLYSRLQDIYGTDAPSFSYVIERAHCIPLVLPQWELPHTPLSHGSLIFRTKLQFYAWQEIKVHLSLTAIPFWFILISQLKSSANIYHLQQQSTVCVLKA